MKSSSSSSSTNNSSPKNKIYLTNRSISEPNLTRLNSIETINHNNNNNKNNNLEEWAPPSPARSRSPSPFPPKLISHNSSSSNSSSSKRRRELKEREEENENDEEQLHSVPSTDLEKYLASSFHRRNSDIHEEEEEEEEEGEEEKEDDEEEEEEEYHLSSEGLGGETRLEERLKRGLIRSDRNGSDDCSIHSAPELETRSSLFEEDEDEEEEQNEGREGDQLDVTETTSLREPHHSREGLESPTSTTSDSITLPSPTTLELELELENDKIGGRSSIPMRKGIQRLPFSLWDYLQEEVLAVEMEGEEGGKSERVTNFLTVPGEVEKIILFGFVICLDSFLYTFTILPLRMIIAFLHLLSNSWSNAFTKKKRKHLRLSHKCDLTKALMIIATLIILNRTTDASKMYHSVRGQETIKLYVIFNVLEIADRLCCSFGQDLQDSLFSRQTLGRRTDGSHPHLRPVALFGLNIAYVVAHTLVLFYQLVTLNVAINSYSNALLTLLLSNQFVEIKGSVFKKFEKENLFQLTCADIVERFQLALMLFIIALRNLIELSSSSPTSLTFSLPTNVFNLSTLSNALPTLSLLQTIFSPAIVVLLSECVVDWLKHAFITKFNHIRPAVYGRFVDVLCKDLVVGTGRRQDQPFVDQSPLVSRRLGFAALPLGCLVVRVILQAFQMLADESHLDECALPLTSSSVTSSLLSSPTAIVGVGIGGFKGLMRVTQFVREGMGEVIGITMIGGGGGWNSTRFLNLSTSSSNFFNFGFLFNLSNKLETLRGNFSLSEGLNAVGLGNLNGGGGMMKGLLENAMVQEFNKRLGIWLIFGMLGGIGWACLIALKLLIGINLRAFAAFRHSTMELRMPEEELNSSGRPRIGITASEKVLAEPTFYLDGGEFDVLGKKKGKIGLSNLSRYDLIKSRLW